MSDLRVPTRRRAEERFGRLMEIYAENYRLLGLLLDDSSLGRSRFVSRVEGDLPLYLEITERHRHTTFVRVSYMIEEGAAPAVDPDAHLRIYHDAEVAEALHCYPGSLSQPLFGALVPVQDVVEHRWRTNLFVYRWLNYLLERGHCLGSLRDHEGPEWPLDCAAALASLDSE